MNKEIKPGHTFFHLGEVSNVTYTTEIYTDAETLDEVVERFREYLKAVGFSPKAVDEYFDCK